MLSLQHLTASLGSTVVLRDVSLDVEPTEVVCIVGDEGSGKTTLLKLLTRELSPQEGVIKIDGAALSQLPRDVLRMYRAKVGYLDESATLDGTLTIARNVGLAADLAGMPAPERDRAVADLLKRLRLTGAADALPGTVSRGERRMAAFARAIASGPAIVLLDEPFQGVADETAAIAATMLQNMRKKGATVVVATAEERTAALFPGARIARMHRGRLTEASLGPAPAERSRVALAEETARAATAELVERSTSAAPAAPAPEQPVPAPEASARTAGRKIRITSVGSL